ncbi:hypothetical protein CRG98_042053 [Punica granatum]|uniref:Uncharacterized protein n=1 Tax=Punica granatum TaxID=22663 RepID=A0A2I0I1A9_PUNGR|nr:hypothetical protein CRG98_042053 [Punica granatum]
MKSNRIERGGEREDGKSSGHVTNLLRPPPYLWPTEWAPGPSLRPRSDRLPFPSITQCQYYGGWGHLARPHSRALQQSYPNLSGRGL